VNVDLEVGHVIRYADPLRVEVERGQRGGYGWSIRVAGDDFNVILHHIEQADKALREMFLVSAEEGKNGEGKTRG